MTHNTESLEEKMIYIFRNRPKLIAFEIKYSIYIYIYINIESGKREGHPRESTNRRIITDATQIPYQHYAR